ncbi:MAG TPA: nucleotidyltransferase family protein [Pyrinomonadaceae bacterium]
MSHQQVGIVILAAGGSTKLGSPKQLVRFKGKTVFRSSVESAVACESSSVIAVLGSRAEEISIEAEGLPVEIVINEEWEVGISSSIKAGLARLIELGPEIDAVIIMLSDQPFVDEKTIRSLIDTYRTSGKPIVASEYNGVLGVPALFDRVMFDDLMALEGDAGARVIIRKSASEKIATISAPEAAFDIDTPQDRDRLRTYESEK